MNSKAIAAAMLALVAGTPAAWAAEEAGNPWDEKPSAPVTAKVRKPPTVSSSAGSTGRPQRRETRAAADTAPQTGTQAQSPAHQASPFGAPVPASTAPALNWGEPIVLKPASAAASAPASLAATSASAPAVRAAVPAAAPMPAAAKAKPEAPVEAAASSDNGWLLVRGVALHTQLQKWAATAGWHLEWKLSRSWVVPADVRFGGTFDQAVEQVIRALANEGKPVNLVIWEGNHVAEVNETAPR